MGIKEARLDLIVANAPLSHHSMNQRVMKMVLEGERRLYNPTIEELYRETEEHKIDHPYYQALLNIQQEEVSDAVPQRIADFAWFAGFAVNNFLRDSDRLPEPFPQYLAREPSEALRRLVDKNKVMAGVIREVGKNPASLNKQIRQLTGVFIINVTSIDYATDSEHEIIQKLQAVDFVLHAAISAIVRAGIPRNTVRAIYRGAARSIWDQLGKD